MQNSSTLSNSVKNANTAKIEAEVEHMKTSSRHNRAVTGRLRAERNALFSEIERLKSRGVRVNSELVDQCRNHEIVYDDGKHVWRDEKLDRVTPASQRPRFDSSWRARELDVDSLEDSNDNNVNRHQRRGHRNHYRSLDGKHKKRRSLSSTRNKNRNDNESDNDNYTDNDNDNNNGRKDNQNVRFKHRDTHENNSVTEESSVDPDLQERRHRSRKSKGSKGGNNNGHHHHRSNHRRSRSRGRRNDNHNDVERDDVDNNEDRDGGAEPLTLNDLKDNNNQQNHQHELYDMKKFSQIVDRRQLNLTPSVLRDDDISNPNHPKLKEMQRILIGEIKEKKALSQNIIEVS